MKKILKNSTVIILFSICFILYLKFDYLGFNYGLDYTFCKKKMPYNIRPIIDKYYSFTLNDEEGFELVGIGFKFNKSSFTINKIVSYGYNNNSIVVKCKDSIQNVKYIISYKIGKENINGTPIISFKDYNFMPKINRNNSYQWFEINNKIVDNIRFLKFIFLIFSILTFLIFVMQIIMKLIQLS